MATIYILFVAGVAHDGLCVGALESNRLPCVFVRIESNDLFPIRRNVGVWFLALEAFMSVSLVATHADVIAKVRSFSRRRLHGQQRI